MSTVSTSYSEFCDNDVIRAATDLTQPEDATSQDHLAAECSSTVAPPFPSTAIGKRKAPDDSVLSDGPSTSYKRRAISTGSPIDIDSLAPLELSGSTLRATTPPLSNDRVEDSFEDRHHHHDAVGPEPHIIIVGIVQRFSRP